MKIVEFPAPFSSFPFFYLLKYKMASRRTKEMHEETISKEEFLDVVNRLVKLEEWAKETEAQNKKDKEEKDMLMDQQSKLKVDNINIQKQL